MRPFKYWRSKAGSSILDGVLRAGCSTEEARDLDLPDYEWTLINSAIKSLQKRRKRSDARSHARERRRLVTELDAFRKGSAPTEDILERLDDPNFSGKREHLVQLLAGRGESGDQWNRWRRNAGRVDLRGAPLYHLDLRGVDLSYADLRRADLSRASATKLNHANLRGCTLRHTDFSSAKLEEAKLAKTCLVETMLTGADLRGADLRGAVLIGTSMYRTDLRGTMLTGAAIWGVNAWDVRKDAATREDSLFVLSSLGTDGQFFTEKELLEWAEERSSGRPSESDVRVDGLAAATFVGMMLGNPTPQWAIKASTDRFVLLLGRFEGKEGNVLKEVQDALRGSGWVPVKFDFPQLRNRDMIETVAVMAGLSCFIIANMSDPRSVALESLLVTQSFAVPFVPILRRGKKQLEMFDALQSKYDWVLSTVRYSSVNDLLERLEASVIIPAKETNRRLQRRRRRR